MNLREAEDIKKRWQQYREELFRKDLHNPDNHNGVITHLDPDILECEVKWALEIITTFIACRFLDRSHSDWCEVVPHCGFDLHFSNNE